MIMYNDYVQEETVKDENFILIRLLVVSGSIDILLSLVSVCLTSDPVKIKIKNILESSSRRLVDRTRLVRVRLVRVRTRRRGTVRRGGTRKRAQRGGSGGGAAGRSPPSPSFLNNKPGS